MNIISKPNRATTGLCSFGRWLAVVMFAAAMSARALVIVPTFDSSITGDANAATVEATINTAIQFYEARFSDPITVNILFQEITTSGEFGHSEWWYYTISYSQYRTALGNDSTTTNDTTALAHLTSASINPATSSSSIDVKTANLRAVGITGLNSGLTNGVDGIIGLHTSQLNLTRTSINAGKGDLLATVEHEMDEVLGLGSGLDFLAPDGFPEDLFRYTGSLIRTYTTNGDSAFFSIDATNLLARFNQIQGEDHGDWWVAGAHTVQVQDASATDGTTPNPKTELIALDVIGYNLLPVPVPVIKQVSRAGTQLTINGTNGLASGAYVLLTSTNVITSLTNWTPVVTNLLGTNGNFTFTYPNVINTSEKQRFFTLRLQL